MVGHRSCLVIVLVVAACARPEPPDIEPLVPARIVAKNPLVISRDELHDPVVVAMDAMRAIRYLRPAFFNATGPQSFLNTTAGQVRISHDYGPLQSLDQLAAANTMSFVEVRYLNANEAQLRFGLNANGGPVIVLLTTKQ